LFQSKQTFKDYLAALTTKCIYRETPCFYSKLYKENDVSRCHVIKLGPNNDEAAKEALQAWPGGLQVGGGITLDNAQEWLSLGASKVSKNKSE
jgi:phosphoribosylformimino-5-aminoimidazole carboxamide ribotide isomerase